MGVCVVRISRPKPAGGRHLCSGAGLCLSVCLGAFAQIKSVASVVRGRSQLNADYLTTGCVEWSGVWSVE